MYEYKKRKEKKKRTMVFVDHRDWSVFSLNYLNQCSPNTGKDGRGTSLRRE